MPAAAPPPSGVHVYSRRNVVGVNVHSYTKNPEPRFSCTTINISLGNASLAWYRKYIVVFVVLDRVWFFWSQGTEPRMRSSVLYRQRRGSIGTRRAKAGRKGYTRSPSESGLSHNPAGFSGVAWTDRLSIELREQAAARNRAEGRRERALGRGIDPGFDNLFFWVQCAFAALVALFSYRELGLFWAYSAPLAC